jgi:hydroxymethylbilane synthase
MNKKIVIGTRGSKLALIQVDLAVSAMLAIDPTLTIETKVITPQGDRDKSTPIPLDTIGKGWFSQEIETELLNGTIDIAVHSLKDMLELPDGLNIGAYLPREDARDVLVTKTGEPMESLKKGAIIGTDSVRRQVQMLAMRPDVVMKSVRGNVPNRLEKLQTEEFDAVILAAAGLKRLGMEGKITRYFSPEEMTPAPGQGIIALECRADDSALLDLLKRVTNDDAAHSAYLERSFSQTVGGGCKAPTGAYAYQDAETCVIIGMTTRDDGSIVRESLRAPWSQSLELGEELGNIILQAREHGTI